MSKRPTRKQSQRPLLILFIVFCILIAGFMFLTTRTVEFTGFPPNGTDIPYQIVQIKTYADTLPHQVGCVKWNGKWLLSTNLPGATSSPQFVKSPTSSYCADLEMITVPAYLGTERQLVLFEKEYDAMPVFDYLYRHDYFTKYPVKEVNVLGDGLEALLLSPAKQRFLGININPDQQSYWQWDGKSEPSCENLGMVHLLSTDPRLSTILPGGVATILKKRGCRMPSADIR